MQNDAISSGEYSSIWDRRWMNMTFLYFNVIFEIQVIGKWNFM